MKSNNFIVILISLFIASNISFAQTYSLTKTWEIDAHSVKSIGDIDGDGFIELMDNSSNDSTSIIRDGKTGAIKYNVGKNGYIRPKNFSEAKDYDYNGNGVIDFFTDNDIVIDPSTKEILFDFKKLNYGSYYSISGPYDINGDKNLDFLVSDGYKVALFSSNIISTSIIATDSNIPVNYKLEQNYPNPFNPTTTIEYFLPKNGNAKIEIFDTLGKLITVIDEGFKTNGNHKVSFDGNAMKLASGVYYYRLVYEGNADTKKMILLK